MQHVLAGPLDAHQLHQSTGGRCYLSPTSLRRGDVIELLPWSSGSGVARFLHGTEIFECPEEAIVAALPAQSAAFRQEKVVEARSLCSPDI